MPAINFFALKQLLPMSKALEALNWRPVSDYGGELRGPCPVHGSRNHRSRSLAISGDKWYCHSCKRYGDQFDLVAQSRHVTVFQAALALAVAHGVKIPWLPRSAAFRLRRNRGEER